MNITKKRSLRRIFAGILCMGILFTGAAPCAAAAYGYDEYGDPIVTATPVPDSQSGQVDSDQGVDLSHVDTVMQQDAAVEAYDTAVERFYKALQPTQQQERK